MKQRVEEMEREANKLRELQAAAEKASGGQAGDDSGVPMVTDEDRAASDSRSIYVGNVSFIPLKRTTNATERLICTLFVVDQVDYGATPEEIQVHFQACGTINRVTILCDKFTGHPKGFVVIYSFYRSCSYPTVLHTWNLRNQNI
jgi:polyadenylate-binding protein 2